MRRIIRFLLIASLIYGATKMGACDISTGKNILDPTSWNLGSISFGSSGTSTESNENTAEMSDISGFLSNQLPTATNSEEAALMENTKDNTEKINTTSVIESPTIPSPSSEQTESHTSSVTSSTANTSGNVSSGSATASSKKTSSTTSSSSRVVLEPTTEQLRYIEERFYELVCIERAIVGVGDLEKPEGLDQCAGIRANEIVTNYSHTRPNGNNFYSVMKENHYREGTLYASGEIIGMSFHVNEWQGTMPGFTGTKEQLDYVANALFQGFKDSPPHYKIMIDKDYKDIGVGVSYEMVNANDPETKFICFFCAGLFTT